MNKELTTQDYIGFCNQMWNQQSKERDIDHALLGIGSEVGELLSCYKKEVGYGRELDTTNILEECGDLLFFTTMFHTLNFTESDLLDLFKIPVPCISSRREAYLHALAITRKVEDLMTKPSFELDMDILFIFKNTLAIAQYHNFTVNNVITANMNKLNVRYPGKYDPTLSLQRDLKAERESLENDAKTE